MRRARAASVRPPEASIASASVSGYSSEIPRPATASPTSVGAGTSTSQKTTKPTAATPTAVVSKGSVRKRFASQPPATASGRHPHEQQALADAAAADSPKPRSLSGVVRRPERDAELHCDEEQQRRPGAASTGREGRRRVRRTLRRPRKRHRAVHERDRGDRHQRAAVEDDPPVATGEDRERDDERRRRAEVWRRVRLDDGGGGQRAVMVGKRRLRECYRQRPEKPNRAPIGVIWRS